MELALSLGDAPKPFTFLDKTTKISNNGLGFCMGVGSGFRGRSDEKIDIRVIGDRRDQLMIRGDEGGDKRIPSDPPVQLDLLPFSPVPRNQPPALLRLPWLTDNCNAHFALYIMRMFVYNSVRFLSKRTVGKLKVDQ